MEGRGWGLGIISKSIFGLPRADARFAAPVLKFLKNFPADSISAGGLGLRLGPGVGCSALGLYNRSPQPPPTKDNRPAARGSGARVDRPPSIYGSFDGSFQVAHPARCI